MYKRLYFRWLSKNSQPGMYLRVSPLHCRSVSTILLYHTLLILRCLRLHSSTSSIQAKILDGLLKKDHVSISKVINLAIDDELLVKRITGRVIHKSSGRSYNIYFNPPKVSMIDDITGEPLMKRDDDNAEALRTRLKEFHNQTSPVLEYYKEKVATINADNDMEVISQQIRNALNN